MRKASYKIRETKKYAAFYIFWKSGRCNRKSGKGFAERERK